MDYSPLWISIKTSVIATCITFFIGLYAANKMADYQGRFKGLLDGLFQLPLVLPPTVVGFFLLMIFGRNGWVGQLLGLMDIKVIFTQAANVIAATTVSFPMMYKTARSSFEQVDASIIDAAKTLGASKRRIFWKVRFPIAWTGVAAGAILSFARAMGEFGATLMIAGSILGKTRTMPIAIFFASEAGKEEEALLWVSIIVAISLTVIFMMNYWLDRQQEKMTMGKGEAYEIGSED